MIQRPLALVLFGGVCMTVFLGAFVFAGASSKVADSSSIEVEFEDNSAVLRGKVFLPSGQDDVPGVIILGGSERGPLTLMKNRLAQHFADSGIAALIYDSPGTGRSTGNAMFQTREDRAREALVAVRCLRNQKRIRTDQVGIMGISEGALVTLIAAAHDESVAFAIPVSGAFGVPVMEIARYRIEVKGLIRGLKAEELQKAILLEEILFGLLAGPDLLEWRLIEMKASQWPQEPWDELIDTAKVMRDAASDENRDANWNTLKRALAFWRSEPWFELAVVDIERFDRFMSINAAQFYMFLERGPLASGDFDKVSRELQEYPKISCPVFAVWGDADEYLPPKRSAAFLKKCLSEAGHEKATYLIVPEASHILTAPGSDTRFVDGYPKLLTDWIKQQLHLIPTHQPIR